MKLALISDIHEDVVNLTKALKLIEKAGCDEIACLGDIVGFSSPFYKYHNTRDANECIRLICENAKYTVAGNHDHYAIRKLPVNIPGFDLPDNWYELPFDQRLKISGRKLWLYEENELSALLSEKSAQWLGELPEMLLITVNDIPLLLSHFLFPDFTGITTHFTTVKSEFQPHDDLMNQHQAHLSLFGHTHQAGLFTITRGAGNENPELVKKTIVSHLLRGVGIPAIARSKGFSGFAVMDTFRGTIKTIALNSGFKIL
jgi:predicted phosphodiesterase